MLLLHIDQLSYVVRIFSLHFIKLLLHFHDSFFSLLSFNFLELRFFQGCFTLKLFLLQNLLEFLDTFPHNLVNSVEFPVFIEELFVFFRQLNEFRRRAHLALVSLCKLTLEFLDALLVLHSLVNVTLVLLDRVVFTFQLLDSFLLLSGLFEDVDVVGNYLLELTLFFLVPLVDLLQIIVGKVAHININKI